MTGPTVGERISVGGGYDFQPAWLGLRSDVVGHVAKRIPGQNSTPCCVVELDEPLTATGDVRGKRESRTGSYLVLGLRYTGQDWSAPSGTVHVELCAQEPENMAWSEREAGARVESNATYRCLEPG